MSGYPKDACLDAAFHGDASFVQAFLRVLHSGETPKIPTPEDNDAPRKQLYNGAQYVREVADSIAEQAIENGHLAVLRTLFADELQHEFLAKVIPHSITSWLRHAIEADYSDIVEFLASSEYLPSAAITELLHVAIAMGSSEIALILLDHGAEVNSFSELSGESPLHLAARNDDPDSIHVLVAHGATVNVATNVRLNTPLHVAAQRGARRAVDALLRVDQVDIDRRNGLGSTPLYVAQVEGHDDIVRMLVRAGADTREEAIRTPRKKNR